jgi:hypothetical protein
LIRAEVTLVPAHSRDVKDPDVVLLLRRAGSAYKARRSATKVPTRKARFRSPVSSLFLIFQGFLSEGSSLTTAGWRKNERCSGCFGRYTFRFSENHDSHAGMPRARTGDIRAQHAALSRVMRTLTGSGDRRSSLANAFRANCAVKLTLAEAGD